ncbi:hypothetical protein GCM10007418_26640 [Halopseudomonas salina]|uniref:Uncharacterized protein n=1 Tax=Halopseudomonas salina TaxID=1323744 RepID=A0ABQ1PY04_9GAMM|nr:hypothetical protein GCM10007418_26640 [Halopseudomonas salina]
MQWVVWALEAAFSDDQVTIQVPTGGQQDVAQRLFRQVHGAGCRDQDTVLVKQPDGLFVQAAIGSFAVALIFALLDEGWRISDDHVELLARRFELAQGIHHVAFND